MYTYIVSTEDGIVYRERSAHPIKNYDNHSRSWPHDLLIWADDDDFQKLFVFVPFYVTKRNLWFNRRTNVVGDQGYRNGHKKTNSKRGILYSSPLLKNLTFVRIIIVVYYVTSLTQK